VLGYRGPFILEGKMPAVPLADVTAAAKGHAARARSRPQAWQPVPLAAAANEMDEMPAAGLASIIATFVTAHKVYRRLGGQA